MKKRKTVRMQLRREYRAPSNKDKLTVYVNKSVTSKLHRMHSLAIVDGKKTTLSDIVGKVIEKEYKIYYWKNYKRIQAKKRYYKRKKDT